MTSEQKLNYYYENLPGIEWQDPEVTTDEIRELQKELEELQKLLEESYPKEELIKMICDKNKEITQMDTSIKLAKVNLEKVKKEVGSDTVYSELEGTVKAVRDPSGGDFTGSDSTVPFLNPRQILFAGQRSQSGAQLGPQIVAPSSIRAWVNSPASSG